MNAKRLVLANILVAVLGGLGSFSATADMLPGIDLLGYPADRVTGEGRVEGQALWYAEHAGNGPLPGDLGYRLVRESLAEGTKVAGQQFQFLLDGLAVSAARGPDAPDPRCPALLTMAWFSSYVQPALERSASSIRAEATARPFVGLPFGFLAEHFGEDKDGLYRLAAVQNEAGRLHVEDEIYPKLAGPGVEPSQTSGCWVFRTLRNNLRSDYLQCSPLVLKPANGAAPRLVLAYEVVDCLVEPLNQRLDFATGEVKQLPAKALFVMDLDPELRGWNGYRTFAILYFEDRDNLLCLEQGYRDALDRRNASDLAGGVQKGHRLGDGALGTVDSWLSSWM